MVDAQTVGVLVTAASVTVAAIYYMFTLRTNQRNLKMNLETRKLQLITSLSQSLFSENGFKTYGELMNMEWKDYDDFERKYGSDFNLDNYSKRTSVNYTYNMIGMLLREKLVEPETLYRMGLLGASFMWYKFEDVINESRRRYMGKDNQEDFEFFAKEMLRIKMIRDPEYKLPEAFLKYIPIK